MDQKVEKSSKLFVVMIRGLWRHCQHSVAPSQLAMSSIMSRSVQKSGYWSWFLEKSKRIICIQSEYNFGFWRLIQPVYIQTKSNSPRNVRNEPVTFILKDFFLKRQPIKNLSALLSTLYVATKHYKGVCIALNLQQQLLKSPCLRFSLNFKIILNGATV